LQDILINYFKKLNIINKKIIKIKIFIKENKEYI